MKPNTSMQIELFAAFGITMIAVFILSLHNYSILPATTTPKLFNTPQNTLIYVAYIAISGGMLALVFKYKIQIRVWYAKTILTWYNSHKHTARLLFFAIGATSVAILLHYDMQVTIGLFMWLGVFYILYTTFFYVIKRFKVRIDARIINVLISILIGFILATNFTFQMALIFFVFLAIYDFTAVFITKHMLILANNLKGMPFAMYLTHRIYPATAYPKGYDAQALLEKNQILIKTYTEYKILPMSPQTNTAAKKILSKNGMPMGMQMGLGMGDFVASAIVVGSAAAVSFLLGIAMLLGVLAGLAITFAALEILHRPLPAIPFIGIGIAASLLFLVVL